MTIIIPDGWQLVPKKATHEMRVASSKTPRMKFIDDQIATAQIRMGVVFKELAGEQTAIDDAWEAMLDAAPKYEEPGEECRK